MLTPVLSTKLDKRKTHLGSGLTKCLRFVTFMSLFGMTPIEIRSHRLANGIVLVIDFIRLVEPPQFLLQIVRWIRQFSSVVAFRVVVFAVYHRYSIILDRSGFPMDESKDKRFGVSVPFLNDFIDDFAVEKFAIKINEVLIYDVSWVIVHWAMRI